MVQQLRFDNILPYMDCLTSRIYPLDTLEAKWLYSKGMLHLLLYFVPLYLHKNLSGISEWKLIIFYCVCVCACVHVTNFQQLLELHHDVPIVITFNYTLHIFLFILHYQLALSDNSQFFSLHFWTSPHGTPYLFPHNHLVTFFFNH